MKDKILEILEGGIELEPEENYHTFNDNRVASEIADMVQKFVEWLAYKSHGNFNSKFDLYKYWDGTTNEWRAAFRQFTGMKWEDISIEDMFTYWFDNIKDKEK
jgi:hypothetical protein